MPFIHFITINPPECWLSLVSHSCKYSTLKIMERVSQDWVNFKYSLKVLWEKTLSSQGIRFIEWVNNFIIQTVQMSYFCMIPTKEAKLFTHISYLSSLSSVDSSQNIFLIFSKCKNLFYITPTGSFLTPVLVLPSLSLQLSLLPSRWR